MYMLGIALAVMFWKWYNIGGPTTWTVDDWIVIGIPFGLTVAWWVWADETGYTKRKAMERDDERRDKRRDAQREALGLGIGPRKRKR
jgi:small Trp-rich protein